MKDERQRTVSRGKKQPFFNGKEKIDKARKEVSERALALCPAAGVCGACAYLGMSYKEQLALKERYIAGLLKGICPVKGIIGMEDPYHYRNKVNAAFQYRRGRDAKKGSEIVSGIYQEGTHRVVNIDSCLLEDQTADAIICTIRSLLKSFKIKVYDEDTGYGLLRHVMIRRGFTSGEVMVVLVASSPIFPSKNNFVNALRERHPEITTVVLNVNDRHTSMVLGNRNIVLYGKGFIEDTLCSTVFRISPNSFYQVNSVQTEKLYNKAVELAGLTGRELVIDAYCGIGTIGLIAAPRAKEVVGVELNSDAVKDAVVNAKRNRITNARFFQGDAGRFMTDLAAEGGKADIVFMDPPRQGSTPEFLEAVAALRPNKVIYISCNPETLARDLKVLQKKGYAAKEAWGVDMFGWCEDVETVVLLSKGEIDSKKVRVEFSLEDMDMSGFQNDATYGQIKERVLQQTGLKVSSLYIAQIKQKYGIIERENYNKPKSENSKQPKCPPEKEVAITEALKFFGMI